MNFTKENFIEFCKSIVRRGTTVDLNTFSDDWGYGYFEIKPYSNESTIRYNIEKISNTLEGISLHCTTRIKEFHFGRAIVGETEFLRYAKEVRLHGSYNSEIMGIINKFKSN